MIFSKPLSVNPICMYAVMNINVMCGTGRFNTDEDVNRNVQKFETFSYAYLCFSKISMYK